MAVAKSGLYDLQQVKRLLDDEAIALMESEGYAEAGAALYVKIVFGSVAVVAAVWSHFNPWSFPEQNYRLIVACVLIYGLCAGVMQVVSFFLEGASFYSCYLPAVAKRVRAKQPPRVWLSSTLSDKSGSSIYALKMHDDARAKPRATMDEGYEKYLTTEGTFLRDIFRKDLLAALGRFGKKNN